MPDPSDEPEPVHVPITDELDLHAFRPQEVSDVVDSYLEACAEKGIPVVRIIHGKGIGTLRETVHARLGKDPRVERFALDDGPGGWGATRVWLTG
ncbi:MAG: Smr/MutS family protein [Opitutales bacterium]